MSKFEKIFVIISALLVVSTIGYYSYRLIHYYKIYGVIEETGVSLYDYIFNGSDQLLNKDDSYYFHGEVDNNYVLFSGKLWRIVSLSDGQIKLITDENITTLAYGEAYRNSHIRKWLNPSEEENNGIFYHSIDVNYIDFIDTCVDKVTKGDITCNDLEEDLISLLSIKDFNYAGGINSYLNNNTNFWLSNSSDKGNYYVTNEGLKTSTFNNYQSYGVRPVILLSNGVIYHGGDGTISNPYKIEVREVKSLNDTFSGEYVNYSNHKFRITFCDEDSVTLMLDEILINSSFSDKSSNFDLTNKKSIAYYLNNEFYKSLGSEVLLSKFYNGEYTKDYNYLDTYDESIESYVGLPSIGDMFNSRFNNIFLLNKSSNKSIYTISDTYNIYADDITNKLGIVPVIKLPNNLSITSGDGYITPYEIGGVINEEI